MMLLLVVTVGVFVQVAPAPPPQPPVAEPEIAIPCAANSSGLPGPAIGISRTVQPRVRRQLIAHPPSTFDDLKIDGRVVVSATVGTDGNLCDVQVVASSPAGVGLEATAIASAKGWRFAPATRDGASVPAPVKIEFTFSPWKEGRSRGTRGRTANAEIEGADPLPPSGGPARQ